MFQNLNIKGSQSSFFLHIKNYLTLTSHFHMHALHVSTKTSSDSGAPQAESADETGL
jgi:hypothetical protein